MDYNWKDLNDMPDELNVLFIEGFCQVPWFQNKFWTMPNDNGKKTFQFNEIFVYGAQIQCISTVKASHPMHSESTNVTPKSRVESIAPLLCSRFCCYCYCLVIVVVLFISFTNFMRFFCVSYILVFS